MFRKIQPLDLYQSFMNQKRREQTYQNLLDIEEILGKIKLFWWIQNGLLLGLHRDGDCIEGDENDLDIGIWHNFQEDFIGALPEFQNRGFRTRVTETPYSGAATVALKRNATKVHVHVNCRKGNTIYQPMNKKGGVFVFSQKAYAGFGKIKWQGREFNCPKNIEAYLVERYGDTWNKHISWEDGWHFYDQPEYNPCYREKL